MSDLDLRKGFRAMVSGGMAGFGDEDIGKLLEIGSQALADRESDVLTTDAQYLQEYVTINSSFINSGISLRDAETQLVELNKKFDGRISKKLKKNSIDNPGVYAYEREDYSDDEWENLDEYERDGWMPSSVGC